MDLTSDCSARLLTPKQVADEFGIADTTQAVWRCVNRYGWRDITIKLGRLIRYDRRDIERWLEGRKGLAQTTPISNVSATVVTISGPDAVFGTRAAINAGPDSKPDQLHRPGGRSAGSATTPPSSSRNATSPSRRRRSR